MDRTADWVAGGRAHTPTAPFSEQLGFEVTMSEPREVHATFSPPKGVSSCSENAADDDEQDEPCGPTKSRLDGTPKRCREVWDEFCTKQDPSKFEMNEDLADVAASLAADTFPPVARAALEEQLGLAPGALTDGSVQVVRMRARRIEAEVVVLDPAQGRMRSAYVRLVGPSELDQLARVFKLLKQWGPTPKTDREAT
jgi:hypothetical protein